MAGTFSIQNKIYYHDTDAGGLVYYATYLQHLEEGRYELCLSLGVDLGEYALKGVAFPAVHVEVEYKSPARYGDTIIIYTNVEKIGNSSIHFFQEIKRGAVTLVKAKTVWACVGKGFLALSVPQEIRKALEMSQRKECAR